jgi:hypothetical protein
MPWGIFFCERFRMIGCLMYEIIKDFQTAIVGVIGFLGVIWTIRQNASLAREIETRKLKNIIDGARKIVIEELKAFLRIYENGLKGFEPKQDENLLIPRFKRFISPDVMSEIALLTDDQAQVAIQALLKIDTMDRLVGFFAKSTDEEYHTVNHAGFLKIREMYSKQVETLNEALEKLES